MKNAVWWQVPLYLIVIVVLNSGGLMYFGWGSSASYLLAGLAVAVWPRNKSKYFMLMITLATWLAGLLCLYFFYNNCTLSGTTKLAVLAGFMIYHSLFFGVGLLFAMGLRGIVAIATKQKRLPLM